MEPDPRVQSMLVQAFAEFDRLVALPESERAVELAALLHRAPELASVVQRLLKADADSTGVLDHGLQPYASMLSMDDAAPGASPLDAGDRVGAFVLQRLLGRGGMGEVWLAERRDSAQADAFVQHVALKVLKRGMDSEALSARFVQERRILAELNHPHFARFIDGGISADGRLYFAMEYVDGVNLVEHANARNLGVRERVRLLAAVSEAVAYAQNRLVVHRDLKPSNILVDASGQPRILDFGIAKLLGERAPDDDLTHTGLRALSPAYAAPEQVLGEAISTATDVYSLGVILFELLTGSLPHTRQSHSLEALVLQVNSEQTPAPSHVIGRTEATTNSSHNARMLREVAGDLDTIVLTALKREPARRYASAAALADDLRRWLDGRTIAARPDSKAYRLRKFVSRNRLMVASAGTVLLALVAGLGVALWQANVARENAELARLAATRAENEAATGRRITNFALSMVHELNPHSRITSEPKSPQQLIEASIARARTELKDDPDARAALLAKLGMMLSVTGDLPGADSAVQESLDILLRRDGAPKDEIARAKFDLAGIRMQQSRNAEAEQLLLSAQPDLAAHAESERYAAMSQSHLARIARSQGQYDVAMQRLIAAKPMFAKAWGPDHPNTIELDNNRALLLVELGRFADAEALYRETIAAYERSGGPDFPRLISPIAGLASIQEVRGQYADARLTYERALRIGRDKMGAGDAYVIRITLDLVRLLILAGKLDEAAGLSAGIDEKNLQQRPAMLQQFERTRAALARAHARFDEENAALEAALRWIKEAGPEATIRFAETLADLAMNAIARADFCRASRYAAEAEEMFARLPHALAIDRSVLAEVRSLLLAREGKIALATESLETHLAELRALTGPDTAVVARLQSRLASLPESVAVSNAGPVECQGTQ
jgi:eukaryotic-like serine/threonine-protein kinase